MPSVCGKPSGRSVEELIGEIERDLQKVELKLEQGNLTEKERDECLEEQTNLKLLLESVKIAEKKEGRMNIFDVYVK